MFSVPVPGVILFASLRGGTHVGNQATCLKSFPKLSNIPVDTVLNYFYVIFSFQSYTVDLLKSVLNCHLQNAIPWLSEKPRCLEDIDLKTSLQKLSDAVLRGSLCAFKPRITPESIGCVLAVVIGGQKLWLRVGLATDVR